MKPRAIRAGSLKGQLKISSENLRTIGRLMAAAEARLRKKRLINKEGVPDPNYFALFRLERFFERLRREKSQLHRLGKTARNNRKKFV